jgi:hypothetical protein
LKKLKILIILILLGSYTQAQEYENDGVTTENGFSLQQIEVKARIDSMGGINEYFNQLLDVEKLQKAIEIRRLVSNDTLQDSIAVITDTTGVNIYPRPYYDDTDLWPRLVNLLPYWFEEQETPLVKYNINFKETTDSVFRVEIEGNPQGVEIDADNKAISLTEFEFGFQKAKDSAIDTVIDKISYLRGNLANPLNKWHIEFAGFDEQEYGTDVFKYPELAQHYENYAIGGIAKYLTYKSIENGKFDKILAISDTSGIDIKYRTPSGTIFLTTPLGENTSIVDITSADTRSLENPLQVTAYYTTNNEDVTVGKLNVLSYPKQTFNIVIVPVNNNDFSINLTEIQNELNTYYSQAVTNWNVSIGENINADFNGDNDSTFNANPENDDNYTIDMGSVINHFEDSVDIEDRTFYIFLIDNEVFPANRKGVMPYLQPYGFLFTQNIYNSDDFIKTLAHELGHGAFRLPHFELADNLMSENEADQNNELFAIQWDIIQGNAATLNYAWEEGMASVEGKDYSVKIECKDNLIDIEKDQFLTLLKWDRVFIAQCYKEGILDPINWYVNDNLFEEISALNINLVEYEAGNVNVLCKKMILLIENTKFAFQINLVEFDRNNIFVSTIEEIENELIDESNAIISEITTIQNNILTYLTDNNLEKVLFTGINDEYISEGMSEYFINLNENYTETIDQFFLQIIILDKRLQILKKCLQNIEILNNTYSENEVLWIEFCEVIETGLKNLDDSQYYSIDFNVDNYKIELKIAILEYLENQELQK